jgi:hypothetical protein
MNVQQMYLDRSSLASSNLHRASGGPSDNVHSSKTYRRNIKRESSAVDGEYKHKRQANVHRFQLGVQQPAQDIRGELLDGMITIPAATQILIWKTVRRKERQRPISRWHYEGCCVRLNTVNTSPACA